MNDYKNFVNRLTICRDKYKSEEEFRNAISASVNLLIDAEYVLVIRYDEKGLGIVTIDYSYADRSLGAPYPIWGNEDEQYDDF